MVVAVIRIAAAGLAAGRFAPGPQAKVAGPDQQPESGVERTRRVSRLRPRGRQAQPWLTGNSAAFPCRRGHPDPRPQTQAPANLEAEAAEPRAAANSSIAAFRLAGLGAGRS